MIKEKLLTTTHGFLIVILLSAAIPLLISVTSYYSERIGNKKTFAIHTMSEWSKNTKGENKPEKANHFVDSEGLALEPLKRQRTSSFTPLCADDHEVTLTGLLGSEIKINVDLNEEPLTVMTSNAKSPMLQMERITIPKEKIKAQNTLTLWSEVYAHVDSLVITCEKKQKNAWITFVEQKTDNAPISVRQEPQNSEWHFTFNTISEWEKIMPKNASPEISSFYEDGQGIRLEKNTSLTLNPKICNDALIINIQTYTQFGLNALLQKEPYTWKLLPTNASPELKKFTYYVPIDKTKVEEQMTLEGDQPLALDAIRIRCLSYEEFEKSAPYKTFPKDAILMGTENQWLPYVTSRNIIEKTPYYTDGTGIVLSPGKKEKISLPVRCEEKINGMVGVYIKKGEYVKMSTNGKIKEVIISENPDPEVRWHSFTLPASQTSIELSSEAYAHIDSVLLACKEESLQSVTNTLQHFLGKTLTPTMPPKSPIADWPARFDSLKDWERLASQDAIPETNHYYNDKQGIIIKANSSLPLKTNTCTKKVKLIVAGYLNEGYPVEVTNGETTQLFPLQNKNPEIVAHTFLVNKKNPEERITINTLYDIHLDYLGIACEN